MISIKNIDNIYSVLEYEWDEVKNYRNRTKHGVWFEEAETVFDDPLGRVFLDPEHSDKEDRYLILGMSSAGRLLVVVHCYRKADSVIRIISARKATRKEIKFYEERI